MESKSFFSMLAGLTAGAILGILFAPDKGEVTREKVRKAAAEGYEGFKEDMSGLGETVSDKAAQAKESLSSLKQTLFEQGADLKESARNKILEQLDRLEKLIRRNEEPVDDQSPEDDE